MASLHLGAFLAETFQRRLGGAPDAWLEHVLDDVFAVQRTSEGELIASWRIRFDGKVDVNALAEELSETFGLASSDAPDDLWIIGATERSLLPSAGAAITFASAPEVDYGFALPTPERSRLHCARGSWARALERDHH